MLCSVCHRQLSRDAARCRTCGTPTGRSGEALDLVLPDGQRVPATGGLTLGRDAGCDIQLDQPSVSRRHAQIVTAPAGLAIEDAGSSFGTVVDNRVVSGAVALTDGMRIALGDCEIRVQARTDPSAAARTISIAPGATVVVPTVGEARGQSLGEEVGAYPRVRSGWSLKRLDASEGEDRYVLKDLRDGGFTRLREPEAQLLQLLDGQRSLVELIREAEALCGTDGAARLARLLADLAAHDMLAGVRQAEPGANQNGLLARVLRPRQRTIPHADKVFAGVYERGGFLLFTRPARLLITLVAAAGLAAFGDLIARRYGTPFVVARKVGIGAAVFVLGRFIVVSFHELAHGLATVSYGRRVSRAGIKTLLVFPYAFVDTSEIWFERRRRRIAVSLAGPISDLTVGGAFGIACLLSPKGSVRDILFQLAFAGYVGALFNLNPLLDRDGYHVLVDLLRQPSLRRRSRQQVADVLAGRARPSADSRVLLRYGIAATVWSLLTVAFAVLLSTRYYHRLATLAPSALVWTVLTAFYLLLVIPIVLQIARPLWDRRGRDRGVLTSG